MSPSYTRLSARDLDAGTDLLRRPKHRLAAGAEARLFGRFDLAVSAVWVGRRPDLDFGAYPYRTAVLGGYVLLDAALTVPLGSGLDLFVRAANILDSRYEAVWGYGAPGRTFRTGVRLSR